MKIATDMTVRLRPYSIVADYVEDAISRGLGIEPDVNMDCTTEQIQLRERLYHEVMAALCEVFDFDGDA
jgi:hypothetical protein